MNHVTSLSPISPEMVARIEPCLDHLELCSCIFLLYDNVDTALQHVQLEIQSSRKYLPVLDSALFKAGDVFHEGSLAQWARFCVSRDVNWQEKLLEALLIIKNYQIITTLGRSQRDLDLKFLPSQSNTSRHIDLLRKNLFLMVEDLTVDEWKELQKRLTKEAKQTIRTDYCDTPECLLLILMSNNILKTKKVNQKMDFSLLRSCLKSMDQCFWAHQLKHVEDVINGEGGQDVQSPVNPNSIALRKFDLDPDSPGTILIFNLESYNEKTPVSDRPLSKREGSQIDCKKLEETFNLLKFSVKPYQDPCSNKIINEIATSLKTFCEEAIQCKRERCFAVAILAHGDKDGVFDSNGDMLKWDSIRAELRSSDTVGLPRLLLIQACQGTSQVTQSDKKLEVDKDGPSAIEEHAANLRDLFELSASVSGYAAYRSKIHGSFFIHSFCKNILLHGRQLELVQLASCINSDFDNFNLSHNGKPVFMTSALSVTASKTLILGVPEIQDESAKGLVRTWDSMENKPKQTPEDNQSKYTNLKEKEKERELKLIELKKAKEWETVREYRRPSNQNGSEHKQREDELFQQLKDCALSLANKQ